MPGDEKNTYSSCSLCACICILLLDGCGSMVEGGIDNDVSNRMDG